MSLNIGFQKIAENVAVSFENTILIIVVFGSVIFFAKDFKLGLVFLMLGTSGLFMWFYAAGLNWMPSLVLFFIVLVVLSFTFYSIARGSQEGTLT